MSAESLKQKTLDLFKKKPELQKFDEQFIGIQSLVKVLVKL